jgi:hypothetical protein
VPAPDEELPPDDEVADDEVPEDAPPLEEVAAPEEPAPPDEEPPWPPDDASWPAPVGPEAVLDPQETAVDASHTAAAQAPPRSRTNVELLIAAPFVETRSRASAE